MLEADRDVWPVRPQRRVDAIPHHRVTDPARMQGVVDVDIALCEDPDTRHINPVSPGNAKVEARIVPVADAIHGKETRSHLLSIAGFERNVTSKRIRDKFQAFRSRGLWMGGCPPRECRLDPPDLKPTDFPGGLGGGGVGSPEVKDLRNYM